MESQENEAPQQAAPGTKDRSSIDFAYTDLDAAVEVAKAVYAVGGTACDHEQLAGQLGLEVSGGGYRLRLAGAKTHGLISSERGGRVLLTDLGKRVVDPQKEREARVDAFLAVELNQKVYEEFKGSQLPPAPAIERRLVGFGVAEKQKDKARQVLMRSAKQAGFFELNQDRLIKPSLKQEAPANDPPPPPPPPPPPSGGSGGGTYHPFIEGLLKTLPKNEGDLWSSADRANWLSLANGVFKMLYKGGTDGDVEVTLKRPQQAHAVKATKDDEEL